MSASLPKTVFFGSGACFSLQVFRRLLEINHAPSAVVVPEFPRFSLHSAKPPELPELVNRSPLIATAEDACIPVYYAPPGSDLNDLDQLSTGGIDFILVACWPVLIDQTLCDRAAMAALNLHPSLLPNYRGANPIEQQLQAGDEKFGVSLHLLSQSFDSGDIVRQAELDLAGKTIDRQSIEKSAAETGVLLFTQAVQEYGSDKWNPMPQSA